MSASTLEQLQFAVALEKCLRRLAKELTCADCAHPHVTPLRDGPPCHCGCTSQASVFDAEHPPRRESG